MLKKSEGVWLFTEEYLLEDFIWENLEKSLGLVPLKRQLCISGEYCDILAKAQDNQLAILELKNGEDRYIVHQLTRYYHSLKNGQSLDQEINYSLPIRLIAIAPVFHRHNFIDRQYNLLEIEFIKFYISEVGNKYHLHLVLENSQDIKIPKPINFSLDQNPDQIIQPPPKFLVNHLDKFDTSVKTKILQIRDKILSKSSQIKEIKVSNSLFYGCSKSKPAIQIKFFKSVAFSTEEIQLFLWLPLPPHFLRRNSKSNTGRVHIITDKNYHEIVQIVFWRDTQKNPDKIIRFHSDYAKALGIETFDCLSLIEISLEINLGWKSISCSKNVY